MKKMILFLLLIIVFQNIYCIDNKIITKYNFNEQGDWNFYRNKIIGSNDINIHINNEIVNKSISKTRDIKILVEILILGALLIISIFYFGFYTFRKKKNESPNGSNTQDEKVNIEKSEKIETIKNAEKIVNHNDVLLYDYNNIGGMSDSIKRKSEKNGKRILIVDDEPINVDVLVSHFELRGYETTPVYSGRDAIKLIDKFEYELVLLDLMMPEIDGYDVLKHIRQKYNFTELPVIILTALDRESEILKGFEYGANDYVTKPFEKEQLLARAKNLTELKIKSKENIQMKIREENFRKIKAIKSLMTIIFTEKNDDNMVVRFVNIIKISDLRKYKKVYFFDYYSDTDSLMLRAESAEINEAESEFEKIISKGYFETLKELEGYEKQEKKYLRIKITDNEKIFESIDGNSPVTIDCREKKLCNEHILEGIFLFIPLKYETNIFGAVIVESNTLEDVKEDEKLNIMCENFVLYKEKRRLEIQKINEESEKEYRCKKCGSKLLEYKGEIDYVEIKCKRCGEIGVLQK